MTAGRRTWTAAAAAAALLLAGGAAHGQAPGSDAPIAYTPLVGAAADAGLAAEETGCDAEAQLAAVINDPGFGELDARLRRSVLRPAMWCAYDRGADGPAYTRAIQLEAATGPYDTSSLTDALAVRVALAPRYGPPEAGAEALITLVARAPQVLEELDPNTAAAALGRAPTNSSAALAAHDALARAGWPPRTLAFPVDDLTLDYGARLAMGGRPGEAAGVLAGLSAPDAVLKSRIDARFTAAWPSLSGGEDIVTAAAGARAAEAAQVAARRATSLEPILEQIDALRALGRAFDAVQTAEAALGRVDQFADAPALAPWLHDAHAHALSESGRTDEALAAADRGIALAGENGRLAAGLRINAALLALWDARTGTAATLAAPLEGARFGPLIEAWRLAVRACIADADGRMGARDAAFVSIGSLEPAAPRAAALTALCAQRPGAAAAIYARRLENPVTRGDALVALQTYATDFERRPLRAQILARQAAVKDDPAVRAAAAQTGRLAFWRASETYWARF